MESVSAQRPDGSKLFDRSGETVSSKCEECLVWTGYFESFISLIIHTRRSVNTFSPVRQSLQMCLEEIINRE